MKWPSSITLVRHGESQYNELRYYKERSSRYQLFKTEFNKDLRSKACRKLAEEIRKDFGLNVSDYDTPLTREGHNQAVKTGLRMLSTVPIPDIMIVSPYRRTRETLRDMSDGWHSLLNRECVYDDRIREQEHGLSLLYNDWRVFEVFHPEQHDFKKLQGPYWYQYPQGESVAQVRDRIRLFTSTLIREYAGKDVMIVTHHLTILSIRANFERLSPEEFIRLDEEEKPRNCGVTIYRGYPDRGKDGKLELDCYNRCFWAEE